MKSLTTVTGDFLPLNIYHSFQRRQVLIAKPIAFMFSFVIALLAFQIGSAQATMMTPYQPASNSAEARLADCVNIAKQGDIKSAIRMANEAKNLYQNQRLFDVSFINTMVTIVEQTDSSYDAKILNSVIGEVNQIRQSSKYSGQVDPEGAYHFMLALDRLAKVVAPFNERVSSKLQIFEGKLALELKSNPGFPIAAHEALAGPMLAMARGYATRKDSVMAKQSLERAIDAGFGDIELIVKDAKLSKLAKSEDLQARYQRAIDNWSRTVVSQFSAFPLDFDVENVQGGRITKSNFQGKVVVLDMWATWCAPCRKAIPHYIKLQNEYGSRGVAVLGVSMDNPNDPGSALGTVRDFVQANKFTYVCGMGTASFKNSVPGKYALPTTIFLDRNGMVRYIARGYHDYAKVEAITKILANESEPVRSDMFLGN